MEWGLTLARGGPWSGIGGLSPAVKLYLVGVARVSGIVQAHPILALASAPLVILHGRCPKAGPPLCLVRVVPPHCLSWINSSPFDHVLPGTSRNG